MGIVTGGASGLGEACIRMLVSGGGKAAILGLQEGHAEKLVAELGSNVVFVKTDVTNKEGVQGAVKKTLDAFGGINVAINWSGVGDPGKVLSKKGPMPLSFFTRIVQIDLVGTSNVIRLAVEQRVKNAPGEDGEKDVIINTASVAAYGGQIGQAAYSATKAGVVVMTLPIARECASYGIRVMTIAPGLFKTPLIGILPAELQDALGKMVPFPTRAGTPLEYAALCRHIIENVMLNGETIRLDGAFRMAAK